MRQKSCLANRAGRRPLDPGLDRRAKKVEAPEAVPRQGTSESTTLFNGKDLDGWAGRFDHWSVSNGINVGKNNDPVPISTCLLTERNYSEFPADGDGQAV